MKSTSISNATTNTSLSNNTSPRTSPSSSGTSSSASSSALSASDTSTSSPCSLIVLTGGPGAGKTAVLDLARRSFCQRVAVLPEAASVIFGGGFWRFPNEVGRRGAQRAIHFVQRELEYIAQNDGRWVSALCDRGTLDGLAYWPGSQDSFWESLGTTLEHEYARYTSVIHLRTPPQDLGYNHQNPLRQETAEEAAQIDQLIAEIWKGHPRYTVVDSHHDFLAKAQKALQLILRDLPSCCHLNCSNL